MASSSTTGSPASTPSSWSTRCRAGRRSTGTRGPQAHRPAAAVRGGASGAAAGAHRRRRGPAGRTRSSASSARWTGSRWVLYKAVGLWRCILRGATQADADDRQQILTAPPSWSARCWNATTWCPTTSSRSGLTATPDLTAEPAYAAWLAAGALHRRAAWRARDRDVGVPGALLRVLRLLAHVETPKARSEMRHVHSASARGRCAPTPPQ
ncbi:hypothetical protein HBB16_18860 [Pseudonocardia sp. MCCB 268]|nr:hypothetical protein [Pseudonocardia cytotoxica]